MKRIDIEYGGQTYCVGDRELEDLQREISEGIRSGDHWLHVNDGEGQRRDAYLHLGPGVSISVVPVPEERPI
ncbi:MAG: hypothetical protein K0Q58_1510 [Microbacterium sp.]|jgi:hypothetical protein|nr:hypothetical protein [Microbacterium sp.]